VKIHCDTEYARTRKLKVLNIIIPETRQPSCAAIAWVLVALVACGASAAPVPQSGDWREDRRTVQNLQFAQTPPREDEWSRYTGLHGAVAQGDIAAIKRLISNGVSVDPKDGHGRTPLMVAGYKRNGVAARALIDAGANLNALDDDQYDLLTIASVLNDIKMVKLAIEAGANTGLVTSPYEGTALIAAAHLGHVDVVRALIDGKAPLDHVNNLGWTALIEAIVLGDGGQRHTAIVRALIDAGADLNLPDRNGTTPLQLAMQRDYDAIVNILRRAGAQP
jgi:ankyrin repeat protein